MSMLPTFPKIVAIRSEANARAIKAQVGQLSPLIGMVAHNIQFEGGAHQIARHEDDAVDENPLTQVSAEISIPLDMRLTELTGAALDPWLADVAEQMARGQTEAFYAEIDRVTSAVGNVVDGGGQPMTEDLLLETLDKMDHVFDEDGTWRPPTIFAGEAAIKALAGEGAETFNRRLDEILQRKREFRRREADRKLVG